MGDQKPQNTDRNPFTNMQLTDEYPSHPQSVAVRSRSRHLIMMNNLKKKEQMWDSRFHLQHLPKYDINNDKYSQNIQHAGLKQVNRNQVEFAPGKIRKKPQEKPINEFESEKSVISKQVQQKQIQHSYQNPHHSQSEANPKNLIPPNNIQLKDMIKENFQKLKVQWEALCIPFHHREVFVQCCKQISYDRVIEIVLKELEDLKKGDSFIQNCVQAIIGREQCILEVQDQIIYMQNNSNSITEEMIQRSSELITHLRLMSVNVVENIVVWRNYLMQFLQNQVNVERQSMVIPYLFNDQNYLIKMRNDLNFLRISILNQFFLFSLRPEFKIDPFILCMTDTNIETYKQMQYISKNLKKRIDNCILILKQEYALQNQEQNIPQMNSKKPIYNRNQRKLLSDSMIFQIIQQERYISNQRQPDQTNLITHRSGMKDNQQSNSSIQNKQNPQNLQNIEESPQKYIRENTSIQKNNENSQQNSEQKQNSLVHESNEHNLYQDQKVHLSQNYIKNEQYRKQLRNQHQQKSTSEIYQSIRNSKNGNIIQQSNQNSTQSQSHNQIQNLQKQEDLSQSRDPKSDHNSTQTQSHNQIKKSQNQENISQSLNNKSNQNTTQQSQNQIQNQQKQENVSQSKNHQIQKDESKINKQDISPQAQNTQQQKNNAQEQLNEGSKQVQKQEKKEDAQQQQDNQAQKDLSKKNSQVISPQNQNIQQQQNTIQELEQEKGGSKLVRKQQKQLNQQEKINQESYKAMKSKEDVNIIQEELQNSQDDIDNKQQKNQDNQQKIDDKKENQNNKIEEVKQDHLIKEDKKIVKKDDDDKMKQKEQENLKKTDQKEQNQNEKLEEIIQEELIQESKQQIEEDDDCFEGVIGVPNYFEEDLIQYTDKYLQSIDVKIKESVLSSSKEIQRRIRSDYECGCLEYKKNGKLKGIAYYFNEHSELSRKINLMHISAVDQNNLEQFLSQIISYIFKNDTCNEIRISIYHHENQEGNLSIHKEIQTIFTSQGFKWKQVINDKYTHQRTTILALRRPTDIPPIVQIKQFDHIAVQSVAIIQESASSTTALINQNYNFDMTVNLLGGFNQVIQSDQQFEGLLSNNDNKVYQKYSQQIDTLSKKNYKYPDIKKQKFDDIQNLNDALKQHSINYDPSDLTPNSKIFSSLSKLALKWTAFSQCTIEKNLYLRMNIPQEIDPNYIKADSKINKKVYVIPTDDQNTNIFVFEIDNKEEFLSDFQQNVKDVMKSLKNTEQMQEDLFFPAFQFLQKSQQSIVKDDKNYYTYHQQLYISTNYQTNLPKIKINVQKQSLEKNVIKPPFVFGFINNDIDEMLEIPYYATLIETNDCIKV